ncbi:MAG: hypothetical protein J6C33_01875 [Lachnospiraceae bacterium]|nr:hypothetical protein [Lachnospiraceae bacterium]
MKIREHEKTLISRWEGARQCLLLGAFLSFFGLLACFAPIGIYPDSGSYISSQAGREPLYPLFLMFFRFIFREGDTITWLAASGQLESEKAMELIYTWPALRVSILVQGLLAGFSCFFLTRAVKHVFDLNWFLTGLVALCTLIPHVLTPLASSSRMVLSNAVLTEGISFPLFYLFTAFMILGLFAEEKKGRFYGAAFLCALLLVLTRNQMLVAFAAWCAVMLFEAARRRSFKRLLLLLLSILLFFGARSAVNRIYNRAIHEGYAGANTGSYNLLTTMLYLSEPEDALLITDEEQRALFTEMHVQMEEGGMTRADAPDGILGRAYHYEDCYDTIGFTIQQPCLFGYAAEKGIPEGEALNEVVRVAGEMNRDLLPHLAGAYCCNYIATAVSGLTRSVSASGTVMGIYSIVIYFLAAALVIYLYRKNKRSKAALLMLFAMLMICANVFATALMIMCLSRYMIYNTALFYIAGLMCLTECYQIRKREQSNGL